MTPAKPADNAATVIIGETVRPGCEKDYVSWQQEVNSAASRYPGFIAAEINSPTSLQANWSVIYRFDSIANLRAWMNSDTRQGGWQNAAATATAHPRSRSSRVGRPPTLLLRPW
jgi:antibiotic biosynthesis monooxygenase (ABM) superfamily enzyme